MMKREYKKPAIDMVVVDDGIGPLCQSGSGYPGPANAREGVIYDSDVPATASKQSHALFDGSIFEGEE